MFIHFLFLQSLIVITWSLSYQCSLLSYYCVQMCLCWLMLIIVLVGVVASLQRQLMCKKFSFEVAQHNNYENIRLGTVYVSKYSLHRTFVDVFVSSVKQQKSPFRTHIRTHIRFPQNPHSNDVLIFGNHDCINNCTNRQLQDFYCCMQNQVWSRVCITRQNLWLCVHCAHTSTKFHLMPVDSNHEETVDQ